MAFLSKSSLFATFRETFWKSAALTDPACEADHDSIPSASSSSNSSPRKPGQQHKALKALDLRALPRDDGPPTELRARRDKFAFFEHQCSEVDTGLFLGSDAVARNWETLEAAGISHVVNCVGFIYPAYFEDRLQYKILYLQGQPRRRDQGFAALTIELQRGCSSRALTRCDFQVQIRLGRTSFASCMTRLTSYRYNIRLIAAKVLCDKR